MMKLITYLSFLLILVGCVEPFNIEGGDFEKLMVVDALLTNEETQHQVRLEYSHPLDTIITEGISGAEVYIIEDGANRLDFTESSEERGTYLSNSLSSGKIGSEYQLFINTSDNQSYASTVERMNPQIEVDSIYGVIEEQLTDNNERSIDGVQLFVDGGEQKESVNFARFSWSETYLVVVPTPSRFDVVDKTLTPREKFDGEIPFEIVGRTSPIGRCYTTQNNRELLLASSEENTQNRIPSFPIRFINRNAQQLRNRYSIEVSMFSVSEENYTFYENLKKNNESSGSFFDEQKGTIVGNITALDSEEIVLGNFEASSISKKRVFFDYQDFEGLDRPSYPFPCDSLGQLGRVEAINLVLESDSIFLIHAFDALRGTYSIGRRTCLTCIDQGTTTVPEFWED